MKKALNFILSLVVITLTSCSQEYLEEIENESNLNEAFSTDNSVDIYILAGESNIGIANTTGIRKRESNGVEILKSMPEDMIVDGSPYKGPLNNVNIWNYKTEQFEVLEAGVNANMRKKTNPIYGSEISMMHEIHKNVQKPIYLIKYGYGGTTMANRPGTADQLLDWNAASTGELTDSLIMIINKVKMHFNSQNIVPNFKGVVFWIGVNDGANSSYANTFKVSLLEMVNKVRTNTPLPQLPFIVSKVNDELTSSSVEMVRNRMSKFVLEDKYSEIFSTDNYPTTLYPRDGNDEDGPHFTGAKYLQIGKFELAPVFLRSDNYPHSNYLSKGNYINGLEFPSGIALDEAANKVYIANGGKVNSSIVEYNMITKSQTTIGTYIKGAAGLEIAQNPKRLFMVKFAESIIKITNLSTGEPYDFPAAGVNNVVLDQANNRFYVSYGNSTVKVYNLTDYSFIQNLPQVFSNSNDMKIHNGYLYVCSTNDSKIYKINLTNYQTEGITTCVPNPSYLAINADQMVVVSGNDLFEVNEATNQVTAIKRGFDLPKEIAFDASGKLYVCNRNVNYVAAMEK